MDQYAIGLYEKAMPARLSWKEKLETAKELGYHYLEISIDETEERLARLDWTKSDRAWMVDLMKVVDLPIRSMCLSAHRKYPFGATADDAQQRSMDIMLKAIDLADDLGIRTIQLAGYDVYYEEGSAKTRERFLRGLKRAVSAASVRGIQLGFETMETPFMNTVSKAMHYVQQVHSPYLGVYPDVGNLTNAFDAHVDQVLQDMQAGRGHLLAIHLKETLPGQFREIPFGTGHVSFETVIRTAWKLGVRRYVTEMWDVGRPEWKAEIAAASHAMRTLLDQQTSEGGSL